MRILALDDSEPALKLLVQAINEACPEAKVCAYTKPSELLQVAKTDTWDIAFLDVSMWGMNGFAVAAELKNYNPCLNIIFVTAYSECASEAFSLHASGYILKPVTKEAVLREIDNLRHPLHHKHAMRLHAQTFGNFETFFHGQPIKFRYSKTKELLAYLIDRNGATSTMSELCAVLWEDKNDTMNLKAYLRKLISDLRNTLKTFYIDDIILKRRNSIAIIPDKIVCDSYDLQKGEPEARNTFKGEYMVQYSWAEETAGYLTDVYMS
jgi:two-component SAPR family response regulator